MFSIYVCMQSGVPRHFQWKLLRFWPRTWNSLFDDDDAIDDDNNDDDDGYGGNNKDNDNDNKIMVMI